jgi:DNA-binding NtrC family response regulator
MHIAERAGARETAGEAALTAVEGLCGWLDPQEAINLYEFAYSRLESGRHARARTLRRLGAVAHTVYAPGRVRNTSTAQPRFWDLARRLAGSNSPALVTGKKAEARLLLAAYAHALSGRPGRFVTIDCDTIEDEIPRPEFIDWAMREAAGGTLFLDRMDELSRHLQLRLHDIISQGFASDASETLPRAQVPARIVAGTSCDLASQVALGCFDAGLFEALGGRGPHQAPAAQELEELRLLSACFDDEAFGRYGRTDRNPPAANDDEEWKVSLEERVINLEIDLIRKALLASDGHTGDAAKLLGMKRQTLEGKINNRKYQALQEWRTPVVKRGRGGVPH